jgi:endonuclease/exonuclease/phosphatase (EEP) superfamily protein YafD
MTFWVVGLIGGGFVKIISLNAWGGARYAELMGYLRAEMPDILLLQEVVHSPDTTADWLTYRDGAHVLPQRANLFAEVARALPDHAAYFCPAAQGSLWQGDREVPSYWGIASFVHKRLVVVGQTQGFVHKDFGPKGFGAHPRSRSAHVIRLHEAGRLVTVGHMHGLRDLGGKGDTPERLAQAERLAGMVRSVAGAQDEIVVGGDFNVAPGSATFAVLGGLGLNDLVTGRGFSGTRTSLYQKPGRFADYMLVNAQVQVRGFQVVMAPEVSDHCPLVLTI